MNITQIAIRRPVTVAMFTLASLVFGLVLLGRLGFDLLPELSYPTLTVRTEYPGAAPSEVENLISRPLEGVLGTIKGLRQIRSVSKAGRSDVYLEFHWGTNIDIASLDVREKLEQVQLPLDVQAPSLLRFNPANDPIIRISLRQIDGEKSTGELASLRRFADLQLSRRLETIEGVAAAKASGGLEDEIQILLNQDALSRLNLSVEDIANRLRTQNINVSGGQIRNGHEQLLVRTFNEFQSLQDFANTVVTADNGRLLRLKDIADIRYGHKERTAIIRHNGDQAVELAIYKEGDANTVQVAERVRGQLKTISATLPEKMQLTLLSDASRFIKMSLSELVSAALWGGLLAMLVIYLFLNDIRATLIISATIPFSVIITFNLMYYAEIGLNIMSLGGLALAVGMLVDNAIVVLENIARNKEAGLTARDAALQGTNEVRGAIIASTLTTIAVFLPLIFVDGIAGQLFNDQALTITFSLLVSLLMAITLIPTLAARDSQKHSEDTTLQRSQRPIYQRILLLPFELIVMLMAILMFVAKWVSRGLAKLGQLTLAPLGRAFRSGFTRLEQYYEGFLFAALQRQSLVLTGAFLIFVLSLYGASQMPKVVLPEMAQGQLVVKLEFPAGTAIDSSDAKIISLSREILTLPEVKEVFASAGLGSKLTAKVEQGGDNYAELNLLLTPGLSHADEEKLLRRIRQLLSESGMAMTADAQRPQLFSFTTPLEVQLFGYELDSLRKSADEVIEKLSQSDRFVELSSSLKDGYPEAQIVFDQDKMAALGLSIEQTTQTLVNAIKGNKATRFRLREQQIDVLVRLHEHARDEFADLLSLVVNPQSSRPITLASVATIERTRDPSEITRIDQQRVAIVRGQLAYGGIDEAVAEASQLLNNIELSPGTHIVFGGQGEELNRSYQSLLLALLLAVFMVYLVMASQFESLLHPFIILLSVPLAGIGAIWALLLTGEQWSVVVFLGLIMLAGIVVNNAIVLIDKINQLRSRGLEKTKAIVAGGRARLRPIMMTTLTTTLGMLPLAVGIGEGAEVRAPMAITVIGGLLVATLLTLIVIPVFYQVLDRKAFDVKEETSLLEAN